MNLLRLMVTLVTALFIAGSAYWAVASDSSEIRTYFSMKVAPFMDARIYKQGALVCAYYDGRCFCNRIPIGIQGLKVSTLITINMDKTRALTIKEKQACKTMEPSWRVASTWRGDTRPVKYVQSLPYPDNEQAFDKQGRPIRVKVGTECLHQTRLSKDASGKVIYPTGKKQWRTVTVNGQIYQAYCEAYQTDIWERNQKSL